MKFTLHGDNARVLAKFVQFLSKVGDDLYWEATDNGLSLGVANSSKSGFAKVQLAVNFFSNYELSQQAIVDTENFCRVSMKACLGVFKAMRNVELCNITLDVNRGKLVVQQKCRENTTKTHYVSILEQENLDATIRSQNSTINTLTASYKVFFDIISIFNPNDEELTLEATKAKITVKNYLESLRVNSQLMRTQLALEPAEFDLYDISEETHLTFCLKEWRAFLILAETLNMNITINFETTGRPIEFKMRDIDCYEVTLYLATLAFAQDAEDSVNVSSLPNIVRNKKRMNETQIGAELNQLFKRQKGKEPPSRTDFSNPDIESSDVPLAPTPISLLSSISMPSRDIARNRTDNTSRAAVVEDNRVTIAPEVRIPSQNDVDIVFCRDTEEDTDQTQPNLMFRPSFDLRVSTGSSPTTVPESPPSQSDRRRAENIKLFRRCFEPTFNPENVTGLRNILADSSDDE